MGFHGYSMGFYGQTGGTLCNLLVLNIFFGRLESPKICKQLWISLLGMARATGDAGRRP
jgi:hypothetical protein